MEPGPDVSNLDQLEAELEAVDAALGRLADGTFGLCDVCGEQISEARLDADPLTRTCGADHQRQP